MKKKIFVPMLGIVMRTLATLAIVMLIMGPSVGWAVTAGNFGTLDLAGTGQPNSNTITLSNTALQLFKAAFDSAGNPIANTSTLLTGTEVRFMLYIDNAASIRVDDVSIQDTLDPLFDYTLTSLSVVDVAGNCVNASAGPNPCDAADEAAMYTAANIVDCVDLDGSSNPIATGAICSDAVDLTDVGSVATGASDVVDIGNQAVANNPLNIAANSRLVVLFRTTLQ